MRKDILLVKHCYDINWAKELNEILGTIFLDPFKFTEKTYLPGRTQQMRYEAKLIEYMRSNKITKLFFVNYTDDFSNNFIKAGFVKEIYGILHSSNNQIGDVGTDVRLKDYENGIVKMATKLFTNSQFLSDYIQTPTIALGLPINNDFKKPNMSDKIIFNQRLALEKGLNSLYEIDEKYNDRIVISSPKGNLSCIPKLKNKFKHFYFKIPYDQYQTILSQCGFVISFANLENFGTSIHEAITKGLCPLVIRNDTTCHKEVIIDELLFDDVNDLQNKIDDLTNNPNKKRELILKQQAFSSKYKKDNYIKNLLEQL